MGRQIDKWYLLLCVVITLFIVTTQTAPANKPQSLSTILPKTQFTFNSNDHRTSKYLSLYPRIFQFKMTRLSKINKRSENSKPSILSKLVLSTNSSHLHSKASSTVVGENLNNKENEKKKKVHYTIKLLPSPSSKSKYSHIHGNVLGSPNAIYYNNSDNIVENINNVIVSRPKGIKTGLSGIVGHLKLIAQILPWVVNVGNNFEECIDEEIVSFAAHQALRHHPPPAGFSLVIRPPPSGK